MATIVDSLILTLGLDPKQFEEGGRRAEAALKRQKEALTRGGKDIEEQHKSLTNQFDMLTTRALGLFAVLAGGKDILQFATSMVNANYQMSRLTHSTNFSRESIIKWQAAVRKAGGSKEEAFASIESISTILAQFSTGIVTPQIGALIKLSSYTKGLGGKPLNLKTLSPEQNLTNSVYNLSLLQRNNPAVAAQTAREAGISSGVFELAARGPETMQRFLQEGAEYAKETANAFENSAKALEVWANVGLKMEQLFNKILASPLITKLLGNPAEEAAKLGHLPGEEEIETYKTGFRRYGILGGALHALNPDWFTGAGNANENVAGRFGEGAASVPAASVFGGGGGLRVKPNAGTSSSAIAALARDLQKEFPELKQFTAFNDAYHHGLGAHGAGQALDFTIANAAQSAIVASKVRAKLQSMGVDAKVIDEYLNPSAGATGGHIHVGFANALAAAQYTRAGGGGVGDSNNNISVGNVTISTQATDAAGIAKDFRTKLLEEGRRRMQIVTQANAGME